MAAGAIRVAPLITHQFPYQEAARAWQLIEERDQSMLGIALLWGSGGRL